MGPTFARAIEGAAKLLGDRIEHHKQKPEISFADHVRTVRLNLAGRATGRHIVYFDTNAWVTIANVRINKQRVDDRMRDFALQVERAAATDRFLFPIGLTTYYELEATTDPGTHESLRGFIDTLSQGCCAAMFMEKIEEELGRLVAGDFRSYTGPAEYLRSPIELLGIPSIDINHSLLLQVADQNTHRKAFYDVATSLPFSLQLKISMEQGKEAWDNTAQTASLNDGKTTYQHEVPTLPMAIAHEVTGQVDVYCETHQVDIPLKSRNMLGYLAVLHWHQNPSNNSLPTLRVLASLHGLLRFDPQRKYHDGDAADFMQAANALPLATAFYTDRKLVNLLNDPRLTPLRGAMPCEPVHGFANMARHLEKLIDTPVPGRATP